MYQNITRRHRWPESLFSDSESAPFTKFLFRVRQIFEFENPIPVQTAAAIIDPAVIYPYFYLRNDHTDSATAEIKKWRWIQVRFFPDFLLRHRIRCQAKFL